jgi:TonB family protein
MGHRGDHREIIAVKSKYNSIGGSRMLRLLLLAGIAATTLAAPNASGGWVGTVNDAGVEQRIYLGLWQRGVDLIGTATYGGEVLPIEHAVVNDNKATFEIRDISDRVTTFELMLAGDRLSGQVNFGGRPLPLNLSPLTSGENVVVLSIEVDARGRATNIRVHRSLGLKSDEKAIEAVRKLRFGWASWASSDGHRAPLEVILPQ